MGDATGGTARTGVLGLVVLAAVLAGTASGLGAAWMVRAPAVPAPAPCTPPREDPSLERRVSALEVGRGPALQAAEAQALDALRAELVRLREELTALQASLQPEAPTARPESPPPPASIASGQEGHGLIDLALSRGRWDEADAERLRLLLAEMTDAQRMEVMLRLNRAANEGRLRLETRGPPF